VKYVYVNDLMLHCIIFSYSLTKVDSAMSKVQSLSEPEVMCKILHHCTSLQSSYVTDRNQYKNNFIPMLLCSIYLLSSASY
jgi:hypothetical protein